MIQVLRHLFAIAALPFMVAVVVPVWIARRAGTSLHLGVNALELAAQVGGLLCLVVGLLLFASSLRRFATVGQGTLAPWDPPRKLVVNGPYRYVRNPMISGVCFVLFAEALLLLSTPHAMWALAFVAMNLIYIPLIEEPQLERRFGESYRVYCQHVRRILPRLRPWDGGNQVRPA